MIHRIKLDTKSYQIMQRRIKTFDILPADRVYRIGDVIIYREFEDGEYTGREVTREILYKEMKRPELKEGYVILAISSKKGRPRKE